MTSNDVPQRLRLAIKTKLTTLDAFIDDELPDFIMVMVARKKSEEEMVSELEPFLEENAKLYFVGDEALRKAQWNGKIGNDFPEHSVTNDTQTKSIIEPVQVPF